MFVTAFGYCEFSKDYTSKGKNGKKNLAKAPNR